MSSERTSSNETEEITEEVIVDDSEHEPVVEAFIIAATDEEGAPAEPLHPPEGSPPVSKPQQVQQQPVNNGPGEPAQKPPATGEEAPPEPPANPAKVLQPPEGSPPIVDEPRQKPPANDAPVEPAQEFLSERSDETEIIEEVIDDSEHVVEEEEEILEDHEDEEIVDDDDDHDDDDGTDGGRIISDASAFRAATENITEMMHGATTIEMSIATKIIQDKHKTVNVVYRHFPGSLSCHVVFEKVRSVLQKHGYLPKNMLLAHSICPDEQQHLVPPPQSSVTEGDRERTENQHNNLTKLFENYFGRSPGFSLGGLAGIPFAGKSGFASFAHNVPENGHGFVFLAPHIGLDSENELGKCDSRTLDVPPYCCRAAVNALRYCRLARPIPDLNEHPEEYQMNYLIQYVNRRKDMLTDEDQNTRQADLAKTVHAIAKNFLDKIVNPFFGGTESTLLIFTGTQINMPKPFEDFFQPRHFYILKKDGKKQDLFKEAFG